MKIRQQVHLVRQAITMIVDIPTANDVFQRLGESHHRRSKRIDTLVGQVLSR